jgi:hypothetical protein
MPRFLSFPLALALCGACVAGVPPSAPAPPPPPNFPGDAPDGDIQIASLREVILSRTVDWSRPVCVAAHLNGADAVPDSAFLGALDSMHHLLTARNCPPSYSTAFYVLPRGADPRTYVPPRETRPQPIIFRVREVTASEDGGFVVRLERSEGDYGETFECRVRKSLPRPEARCRSTGAWLV